MRRRRSPRLLDDPEVHEGAHEPQRKSIEREARAIVDEDLHVDLASRCRDEDIDEPHVRELGRSGAHAIARAKLGERAHAPLAHLTSSEDLDPRR